jgi:sugar phosphate isomerase/epimerase
MPTLLGHTLGTPGLTPFEALDLFATSGLDGAELIWQDDYKGAIPESDDGKVAARVKAHADDLGLRIGCLTPYVTKLNSLDEAVRMSEISRLERAIRIARTLECPRMRIYGGTLLGDERAQDIPKLWARLVVSLRRLGELALDHGVVLCVENHFGTMTVSAADTVKLVEEIASDGVGILYDQANLAFTHKEEFRQAIELQAAWIRHVHVKDLEFIHPDRTLKTAQVASIDKSERIHASRMIGDGILDWQAIVDALVATGYDGSYSLEYEYRWNPEDLPEPAVGFPESSRRLRACFEPSA